MPVMTPAMERVLRRQINKWHPLEEQRDARKSDGLQVITVSRQAGSGGKLVAARVAQEVGLRYYDRELIQEIARKARADEGAVERRDERGHSLFEGWMDSLVHQRQLLPARYLQHLHLLPDDYKRFLMTTVVDVDEGDGGVIVGRGANFILPADRALRVRVVAPVELRIRALADLLELSPARAKLLIEARDADRRAFARYYFKGDIDDPAAYDLVINTGAFTVEQAVASIVQAWRWATGEATGEASGEASGEA